MPTTLKCPNPSCPYLFDSASVPAGVVLACPRCTMRFTLGSTPTGSVGAISRPAHPSTHPPAPPFTGGAFEDIALDKTRLEGDHRPRLPIRGSRLQTVLLVGIAAIALSSAGVAVWYRFTHKPVEAPHETIVEFPEKNLSLEEPHLPWVQDGPMQAMLGAPFFRVFKRDNPEAYIAYGARDFKTRPPRASELKQPLKTAFDRLTMPASVQMQALPPETLWLGIPASGNTFRGQLRNGSVVEGEAYYVTHKGIAYWFLAWTGENQIYLEQKEAFAKVRAGCKLLALRDNWSPQQANVVRFKNNVLGYTIVDGEGIWQESTDPKWVKAQDPNADKYFTASIKNPGSDFAHEAELTILVLDAKGDPLEQARDYVELRENRDVENRGKTVFQPYTEDPNLEDPNPVEGKAPYLLLKSRNTTSDATRLWVISAVVIGDKTIVAAATCSFATDDREQFERKCVVMVRSLQASK